MLHISHFWWTEHVLIQYKITRVSKQALHVLPHCSHTHVFVSA